MVSVLSRISLNGVRRWNLVGNAAPLRRIVAVEVASPECRAVQNAVLIENYGPVWILPVGAVKLVDRFLRPATLLTLKLEHGSITIGSKVGCYSRQITHSIKCQSCEWLSPVIAAG